MFETGMSALVLKICSEYAKSLGLNFPPCTQQEINAICEWVDKHTIKDMTISQDGYNVTFTFKTENDTTKEFTFTIPKKVDIDELEKVLKGSDSVVVDRLVDNSGLQVRLAQSVTTQINGKLDKPATPSAESAVVIGTDGTTTTKPLSEIGGGGKLYRHDVTITFSNFSNVPFYTTIYSSTENPITSWEGLPTYMLGINGSYIMNMTKTNAEYLALQLYYLSIGSTAITELGTKIAEVGEYTITDTVIEV